MIEPMERLQISGNTVEDANVQADLEMMHAKVNQLVDGYNILLAMVTDTSAASAPVKYNVARHMVEMQNRRNIK